MRKIILTVVAALVGGFTGCGWFKKDEEPNYTVTTDVVRRSAPPPILVNPLGTNADGMTAFQLGAKDFLESQDKEALVRSVVAHINTERDRTGNTAVRIGEGKSETNTDEVKKIKRELEDLGFKVTVVEKAKTG